LILPIPIIIPAYNAAKTIVETLTSIAKQDNLAGLVSFVLVIDDASTDNTAQVARDCWQGAVPLKVERNPKNSGERRTINAAFENLLGQTEWVAVIHADDVAAPNWLAQMTAAAQLHPDSISVCSSWHNVYEDGRREPGEHFPERPALRVDTGPSALINTLQRGCWWHFSGCLMHLPRFFQVGAFEADMPQLGDLDWLLRTHAGEQTLVYLPQSLIDYRMFATSVSSVSFQTSRDAREMLRILQRFGAKLAPTQLQAMLSTWRKRLLRRAVKLTVFGQWQHAWQAWVLRRAFVPELMRNV
jgi:glycosyltransferase involved in cell wall biosynthesis